jgi:hypothetical protein
LRTSAGADGTRPKGTIYYMERPDRDVRTEVRRPGFASALAALRSAGVRGEIQKATLPHGRHDVMGLMTGATHFKWQFSSNTILPGAICENLTSLGGALRPDGSQTPLTHLLRYGAAGSSGTVTEPYSIPEKFPSPFLHVHYARGASLAEAFYQSVHGPYQLLIVGDPLCRPWARIPEVRVGIGQIGEADEGRFALQPSVAGDETTPIARYELFLNGQRRAAIRPGETFKVDTREFPDGFYEVRIVAIATGALETQGQAVSGFVVRNNEHDIKIEAEKTPIAWDEPLHVKVSLAGADQITLLQNLREVGQVQGAEGRITLDPRRLGLGPVRLQARGEVEGMTVMGAPVDVLVVPSRPLPAIRMEDSARAPGLLLRPANGASVVIAQTQRRDWLSAAGVQQGQAFDLEGTFDVAKDDVYQFQLFTDGAITRFEVDGAALEDPETRRWEFRPVVLAAGTHRMRLGGVAGPDRRLDVRFGGEGCMPVAAPAFRHVAAE